MTQKILISRYPSAISACLFACFVVACNQDLHREEIFPTAADAIDAGAVERGVLPSWLPDDARDIRVGTELDRNWIWVEFKIAQDSVSDLTTGLRPISPIDFTSKEAWHLRGPEWWPDCLADANVTDCPMKGEFFAGGNFLVVVERDSLVVYAWTSPRIERDLRDQP
jgi:hypothetical protein